MSRRAWKITVIDDDASVRRSMTRLLASAGYDVETFPGAEDFLNAKSGRGSHCLLLDLQMPGLNGLELQGTLQQTGQEIPIVFVSGQADIPDSVQAMKAGAVDFLTKPFDQQALIAAIGRAIEKGRAAQRARLAQKSVENRVSRLTVREREVLSQVVDGRLNKQIAFRLRISEKTVKVHRARVMEKMRAGSVAELVRLCACL